MSVTLDAALGTGKGHTASTAPITTTSAVASGGFIVVGFAGFFVSGATQSVPTVGGLTFTALTSRFTSGSLGMQIFGARAASGLASGTVITPTASTGGHDLMSAAISFLGVDTTTASDATNGSGATNTAWSSGNVTAASGDALVGFCFEDGSGTATSSPTAPGVEFADFNDATQTEAMTGVYKLSVAGTDVIAGTWSASLAHIRAACNLKPLAAGGATKAPPFRSRFPRALLTR